MSDDKNSIRAYRASAALALAVCGALQPASAQQAAAPVSDAVLQEVVVTATKQAESAQSVPVAITAVGGEQLANLNIADNFAIARLAPSLAVESAYGPSQPRWRMRGVGSNAIGPNAQAAVGVYADDVVMSSGNMQGFLLFDLDRVEVLRGPQGTLWGRNITGGAVHFVSKRPTEEFDGYGKAAFGAYNQRDFEGAVGGALVGDRLLGRVSVASRRRDGQYRNLSSGARTGGYDRDEARIQLLGTLGTDTTLYLKAYTGESNFEVPFRHTGLLPNGTDAQGFSLPAGRDDVVSLNSRDDGNVSRQGVSLQLTSKLAAGPTLTAIASYDRASSYNYFDDDAGPLVDFSERDNDQSRQKTLELRLASGADQRVRWIAGAFFLDSTVSGGLSAPFQSNFNFPSEGAAFETTTDTTSYAAFGSVNVAMTEQWGVRAGVRYSRDKVDASGRAWSYAVNPIALYDRRTVTLTYLDLGAGIFRDSTTGATVPSQPHEKSWSKVTGDLTFEYKPSDRSLAYLRAARGYRAGNANTYIYNGSDFGLYNPEQLDDVEAGWKSTWLDGRLRVNASAFHYDIKDMQVTVVLSPGSRTQNAAKAKVDGAELEIESQLTPNLYASLAGGYQKSKYTDFTNGSAPAPINSGLPLDLSGQPFERAPKTTLTAVLNYVQPLASGSLVLSTDWRYTDGFAFQPWVKAQNLNPRPFLLAPGILDRVRSTFSQPSMTIGNASIKYVAPDERLEVGVWGTNLTNRFVRTSTYGFFFNRALGSYLGELRAYGVSMTYHFGKAN